ncbi:hypothetical protein OB919_04890 [Halobacteria archaeon AArc-curdl1]|uniref:Uncharacterized protein n=1 Tax=Natronosalvus hydrolyticus TaxID=2979988 RepID=A0AAP2Z621_9EURY|nr:hypothetical protein [Halobacteria archaeon AArc-curdl1]
MTATPTRRQCLALGGMGVFVGLAGCSSEGSSDGDGETNTDDNEQGSDGGESATAGDDSLADGTGSDGGDDSATDGENGDTYSTEGESTDAVMHEVLNWVESYVVDVEFTGDQAGGLTRTVHEGNSHIAMDVGVEAEAYEVDGVKYEVAAGQCVIRAEPEATQQAPDVADPSADAPSVEATEITTREGKPVYVFELPGPDAGTWHVSTETGYPVQFETTSFVATFHSWGETDPISPPDMNCQEV